MHCIWRQHKVDTLHRILKALKLVTVGQLNTVHIPENIGLSHTDVVRSGDLARRDRRLPFNRQSNPEIRVLNLDIINLHKIFDSCDHLIQLSSLLIIEFGYE